MTTSFRPALINIIILGLILALLDPLLLCDSARTRLRNTLDVKYNPDCNLTECTSANSSLAAINLFQVSSTNPESPDKVNYILSSIGGPPMVITTVHTSQAHLDSKLEIDWENLLRGEQPKKNDSTGLHFATSQNSAIGLLFEEMFVYDGKQKTTIIDRKNWKSINWDLASKSTFHKDDFLRMNLKMRPDTKLYNGTIKVNLAIPRDYRADRQKEIPHLKLNSQSISLRFVLDNVRPPKGDKEHLLTTFIIAVQTPTDLTLKPNIESLISDQYLPGVYSIKSLQFSTGQNETGGDPLGFFHWKEVAYTDNRKLISHTTAVKDEETEIEIDDLPQISPPFYEFFRQKPSNGHYKFYRFELKFGDPETYYSSTNFNDFSFVFGLGSVPQEQMFSFWAKVMIFVCFCLPNVVMLAGLSYLLLKRFSKNSDTELLLAAENN